MHWSIEKIKKLYLLIIDLKIFIKETSIIFKRKILTIDCARYVKAAARSTDLHCCMLALGTYFFKIGRARLKLASNSTGSVIK